MPEVKLQHFTRAAADIGAHGDNDIRYRFSVGGGDMAIEKGARTDAVYHRATAQS